jgi:soluble lytic murein transglycosylase
MQLMPDTGKSSARQLNYPYYGRQTLTDPASNILLGTYYLGQMYDRFDNNMVMATAAYNAGPHRVEQWRPPSGSQDARIWIENIPYNETRGYVRRVLETDVIFNWRLTGNVRRITESLDSVPAQESDQVAISD